MKLARSVLWIGCVLFIPFGLGFMLAPEWLAALITGAAPVTSSGLIDMRATYGGLALAIGVCLGVSARGHFESAKFGLLLVVTVMIFLAAGRVIGMAIDGTANAFMYVLLMAELVFGSVALYALRHTVRRGDHADRGMEK